MEFCPSFLKNHENDICSGKVCIEHRSSPLLLEELESDSSLQVLKNKVKKLKQLNFVYANFVSHVFKMLKMFDKSIEITNITLALIFSKMIF